MRARHLQALAAITLAGGALRFATLGVQSYWLDEAASVNLMHKGFGAMLSGMSAGESTPPLYYILAWLWAKVFGTGEVGLRSLSAVIGTATIPVAYLLGRRVAGRAAGLIAAALVAFNPLLVWYSQEARSYALLVFLTGLTLLAVLAALERPTTRRLGLWALAAVAAIATHYFAGFLVGAEAAWLLYRTDARRRVAIAVGAVVVAAAALLPLALHQRSTGAAQFISATSLSRRVAEVPKQFLVGYQGPLETLVTIVAGLLAAYALLSLARASRGTRQRALMLAGLGAAAILAPIVLALLGPDYLITRNVLPAWLPLGVVVAAGLAMPGARRVGPAAAAALCAVGLALVIATDVDEAYQRDNWRAAARVLGKVDQPRAIIITPTSGRVPLALYLGTARPVPPPAIEVKEIDYVSMAPRLPGQAPHPPRPPVLAIPGLGEFTRTQGVTFTVIRMGSGQPIRITPMVGLSPLDSRPAVVLYQTPK
jgi:4-amino-4-deoxy-L-arabinose transferase-like glycosyltransferase